MSSLFELMTHSSSQTYLFVLLSRFRRSINRSVARAIASQEREAIRYMFRKLADRKTKGTGISRVQTVVRSGLLGLAIAASIYSGLAGAEILQALYGAPVARCCEVAAAAPIRRCKGDGFASKLRQAQLPPRAAAGRTDLL